MTADPGYAEFGSKIDAAIVIGSPGANGIMALGEILSGEINPSGHTVDTVYTNYQNDPTWQNFGDNAKAKGNEYLNQDGSGTSEFYVEYEENIYLGYRYYETRGHLDGEEWYNKNVVYPFGFGLSYTTFEQEITNAAKKSIATSLMCAKKIINKIAKTRNIKFLIPMYLLKNRIIKTPFTSMIS